MSKRDRERNRAERAAVLLAAQRRRERRRRWLVVAGVAAVLVVLVGAGYVVQRGQDTTGEAGAAPSGMTDRYAVTVGDASAPTTVTLYEDPQCPVCKELEDAVGDDVQAAVDDGRVRVEYRIVSFLDGASRNDYSSRAANALLVVQDTAGPEAFAELHRILYDHQPAEGTAGPDDDQLVRWAVEAGADESAVRGGIEDMEFGQFLVNATDQMSKNGVNGTPTAVIDGDLVEGTPADTIAAVRQAVS